MVTNVDQWRTCILVSVRSTHTNITMPRVEKPFTPAEKVQHVEMPCVLAVG